MGIYTPGAPSAEAAGASCQGRLREHNEDSLFHVDRMEPNAYGSHTFGIYLVADGIGGNQGGEIASESAVLSISKTLLDDLKPSGLPKAPSEALKQAIQEAHHKILLVGKERRELQTMGTTVVVGLRLDYELYLAHVGDSRAYLIRDNTIRQLTEDHSVVAALLRQGAVTPKMAKVHPDKGKIYRSLGVTDATVADISIRDDFRTKLTLCSGDGLLFCSDGLTDMVQDEEIARCFETLSRPKSIARRLIQLANSRGGFDDTSVVAVRLGKRTHRVI